MSSNPRRPPSPPLFPFSHVCCLSNKLFRSPVQIITSSWTRFYLPVHLTHHITLVPPLPGRRLDYLPCLDLPWGERHLVRFACKLHPLETNSSNAESLSEKTRETRDLMPSVPVICDIMPGERERERERERVGVARNGRRK